MYIDWTVMVVEVFCSALPTAIAAAADTAGIISATDADNCSSSRQVLGTQCHVTCLPGYQLGQPVDNYTCQYDSRALWYPMSPPVCYGKLSFLYAVVRNDVPVLIDIIQKWMI